MTYIYLFTILKLNLCYRKENIFYRFGTLVAQIPIDRQGWDGTYNGKTLSSDDYWFSVQLIPTDTNKPPILKKGHFSLLR